MTSPHNAYGPDPADDRDDTQDRKALADALANSCYHQLGVRGNEDVEWDGAVLTLTWDLGSGTRGFTTLEALAKKMDPDGGFLDDRPWGVEVVYDDLSRSLKFHKFRVSASAQIKNGNRLPASFMGDSSTGDWPSKPLSDDTHAWFLENRGIVFSVSVDFDDPIQALRSIQGSLRSRVIRLAHQNPDLRPHLLPLLK